MGKGCEEAMTPFGYSMVVPAYDIDYDIDTRKEVLYSVVGENELVIGGGIPVKHG